MTIARTTPQIEERIFALVEVGEIDLEAAEDFTTVLECARRYVELEWRKRQRSAGRNVERNTMIRLRATEKLREQMTAIAEDMAKTLSAIWSGELLGSEFQVGDGTVTTWGEATEQQHELRASMLEGLAAGDLHTASIHRAAILDIRKFRVSSLCEIDA